MRLAIHLPEPREMASNVGLISVQQGKSCSKMGRAKIVWSTSGVKEMASSAGKTLAARGSCS